MGYVFVSIFVVYCVIVIVVDVIVCFIGFGMDFVVCVFIVFVFFSCKCISCFVEVLFGGCQVVFIFVGIFEELFILKGICFVNIVVIVVVDVVVDFVGVWEDQWVVIVIVFFQ